jgi:hypothetical protein
MARGWSAFASLASLINSGDGPSPDTYVPWLPEPGTTHSTTQGGQPVELSVHFTVIVKERELIRHGSAEVPVKPVSS